MSSLLLQIPDVCWTRALLDGSVKVDGFPVELEASVFDSRTSRRLRGEVEERYAGTEQVIPDFLVRLSKGLEQTLVALPVFVTRGMIHRKLVTRRGLTPTDLRGRRVGMGRVLGATSVFLRGLLADDCGIERKDVQWVAAEPLESDGAMGGEWGYLSERGRFKSSELLARLGSGELDAVIYPGGAGGHWYNWVAAAGAGKSPDPYGDLEAMVVNSSDLYFPIGDASAHVSWFKRTEIYPLYHCLALRREIAEENRGLSEAVVDAFDRAALAATRYMSPGEKSSYERELELLGADPNRCQATPLHIRTIEACMDYLSADGLLPRRPSMADVFPLH
jgi:4,5-dihydroxyphthalate decarboxylase